MQALPFVQPFTINIGNAIVAVIRCLLGVARLQPLAWKRTSIPNPLFVPYVIEGYAESPLTMIGDIADHKIVMDAEKWNVSTANKSTWRISMTMATEPKIIVQIARQSLNLEWVDAETTLFEEVVHYNQHGLHCLRDIGLLSRRRAFDLSDPNESKEASTKYAFEF